MRDECFVCNAKTGEVTIALIEVEDTPELVDYRSEIDECKKRLAETDYVVIKIAEGAAVYEEYAAIIAERRALRNRIAELEEFDRAQNA